MQLKAKFTAFLSILLVILPLALSAQEELSLEQAINLALEYNLDLRKASIDLAASDYSERNLWSEIFPTISATAGVSYTNNLFSDAPVNSPGFGYSIGAGVRLGLNTGIPYTIKAIQLAHQTNLLNYENARNQLSIQVTKNYYSLVAEKNNLVLLQEVQNLAQRHYDRNQISFRNGLISELTLTQTRLAAENARFNLSAATITFNNNLAEFLALIGMDTNTVTTSLPIILTGNITITRISANADELILQYLPLRPDIVRNRNEIERLRLQERRTAMQNRAPSLDLSFNWSASNFNPFSDRFSGSAVLNIPIDPWIPGTSGSQSIRRANDSVEKAILDLTITENAAKNQIRTLTARLNNSWDSILIARLSHEAAQRNYQLTELGFNNGTVEYLVLEDARNNMASSAQRLYQSELAYFTMILDLSTALNIDWNYLLETYGIP